MGYDESGALHSSSSPVRSRSFIKPKPSKFHRTDKVWIQWAVGSNGLLWTSARSAKSNLMEYKYRPLDCSCMQRCQPQLNPNRVGAICTMGTIPTHMS